MTLTVALFSLGGAPGVTSLAMALAAVWPAPDRAAFVEVDPFGGAVAVWRRLLSEPGLTSYAADSRKGSAFDLEAHTQVLPGGLRVCPAPVTGEPADAAVRLIGNNKRAFEGQTSSVVILDLGRMSPSSPARALAERADHSLLVTSDGLTELRRARDHLHSPAFATNGLRVVVSRGKGGTGAISDALGPTVWGRAPEDVRSVEFLHGERELRRPARRPLFSAADRLARDLVSASPPRSTKVPVTEVNA